MLSQDIPWEGGWSGPGCQYRMSVHILITCAVCVLSSDVVYCFIICIYHSLMSHVIRVCSSEGLALLLSWHCSVCGHRTSSDSDARRAECLSAEGLSVINRDKPSTCYANTHRNTHTSCTLHTGLIYKVLEDLHSDLTAETYLMN